MSLQADPPLAVSTAAGVSITVGTSAAKLTGNYPLGALLYNNGSVTIYLGGSNVTTANGFPLAAGASVSSARFQKLAAIWAVSGSAGQDLRVLGLS